MIDGLIGTILSQHTSDLNSERALRSLKERFSSWSDVRDAPVAAVADAIRRGGLAEVKAPRIQRVLDRVLQNGTMDRLADLPLAEAKLELTSLPGVGPKTAACVLLFSCGRPALPVDTHVYRVAGRLGLIPPGTSAEAAHDQLERQLAPDEVYSFHVNMIRHGREICHARNPACERCPLAGECVYYLSQRRSAETHG
ncbi:MAG TPA: hypothetical protein VFI42_19405 [Thermomicrobiaceae bacterium]|nr:hypothetical protein [Thermomicrobiaceae bacterium]